MTNSPLKNKTILITGATRGIGREIALSCSKAGANCVFLARNMDNLKKLQNDTVSLSSKQHIAVNVDLYKLQQIPVVIENLKQYISVLDGIILAGAEFTSLSPIAHASGKDWAKMLTVNILAQQQLLFYLEGFIAKSKKPKVVFIDCIAFQNKQNWAGYQISKDGFRTLAKIYKLENTALNRKVGLYNPNENATDLWKRAFPGKKSTGLNKLSEVGGNFMDWYLKL